MNLLQIREPAIYKKTTNFITVEVFPYDNATP